METSQKVLNTNCNESGGPRGKRECTTLWWKAECHEVRGRKETAPKVQTWGWKPGVLKEERRQANV